MPNNARNIYRYERPPILKELMKTLLEINKRMDTIQTDLSYIKTIVKNDNDFVLINETHMELDEPR